MASRSSPQLAKAAKALADAGLPASTVRDRVLLREACVNISTRAARLSAVGVVALLEQMDSDGATTVAVDGTVFECYPYFKERMEFGVELLVTTLLPWCHVACPPHPTPLGATWHALLTLLGPR